MLTAYGRLRVASRKRWTCARVTASSRSLAQERCVRRRSSLGAGLKRRKRSSTAADSPGGNPRRFMPVSILTQSTKRSEEHTSELQSRVDLVCRLLLEKK